MGNFLIVFCSVLPWKKPVMRSIRATSAASAGEFQTRTFPLLFRFAVLTSVALSFCKVEDKTLCFELSWKQAAGAGREGNDVKRVGC